MLARLGQCLGVLFGLALVACVAAVYVVILILPNLPYLDPLTDYTPRIPLRVYTADGVLIGEFGGERRTTVKIDAVPITLRRAILAAKGSSALGATPPATAMQCGCNGQDRCRKTLQSYIFSAARHGQVSDRRMF
jgi:hypothetical protein